MPDRAFGFNLPAEIGWTHTVLNYIGPDNGQGLIAYFNGTTAGRDDSLSWDTFPPGDGRVVIGRAYTDKDSAYASVDVDELLFFNEILNEVEIAQLANTG